MSDPLSMLRIRAAEIGEDDDEVEIVKVIAPERRASVDRVLQDSKPRAQKPQVRL